MLEPWGFETTDENIARICHAVVSSSLAAGARKWKIADFMRPKPQLLDNETPPWKKLMGQLMVLTGAKKGP